MNPTIALLEERGLIQAEQVLELAPKISREYWDDLSVELQDSLRLDLDVIEAEPDLTPFNFVASASLRGLSGCSTPKCRLRKVNMISRYAALFCDRVVFPLHVHNFGPDVSLSYIRNNFQTTILTLLELRPLVEAKIITLIRELDFCPLCHPERFPSTEMIIEAADTLKRNNYSRFKLAKLDLSNNRFELELSGPEEYIEHGVIYTSKPPFSLDSLPYGPLPDDYLKKSEYVDKIFYRIITDVVLQQIYGVRFNAKYLTDLAGEAEVLSALNKGDQLAARTAALCAQLSHNIPLLSEIPLERVIKIRKEDHTSFLNYRIALQRIIRDYLGGNRVIGEKEAKELFLDVLEPEILKMEVQAKTERNAVFKKSGAKIAATLAGVFFGVHSGMVPAQFAAIVAAMGGFAALGNIAEAAASLNTSVVQNHNLFFLLRLRRASEN